MNFSFFLGFYATFLSPRKDLILEEGTVALQFDTVAASIAGTAIVAECTGTVPIVDCSIHIERAYRRKANGGLDTC